MRTLITTHRGMDLDALGAIVAARKIYPDSIVVLPGTRGRDVIKVLNENPDILEFIEDSKLDTFDFDRVVILDTVDVERLPESVKELIRKRKPELVFYDHHRRVNIEGAEVYFKPCGAVTSLLVLILKARGIIPSPVESSIMALGIYSDTGSFLFPSTSPMDMLAASFLLSLGANLEIVKRYLPKELSDVEIDILKALKDNVELLDVNGNRIAVTTAQFDTYVGDVAHLVSKLLEINNYPAVLAIVDVEGTVFIIGRSRSPKVDVSKVVSRFGGGGHREAASAVVRGRTVYEVRSDVLSVLKEVVEPVKLARDIMTFPPKVIGDGWTVREAQDFLLTIPINLSPLSTTGAAFIPFLMRKS